MKRKHTFLLLIIISIMCGWLINAPVNGQSDEEKAYELLGSASCIFPRLLIDEKFHQPEDPTISSERDEYTLFRAVRNGFLKTVLFNESPDLKNQSVSSFFAGTNYGTLTDFHLHVEATLVSEFPEGTGYCFVEYTNVEIVEENNRESVIVDVGQEASAYKTLSGNRKYTTLKDLRSDRALGKTVIVDMIRLDGVAYLFTDGNFIAKYEDGIQTNLTWMIGAGTTQDGEQTTCFFDNLQVRRK